MSPGESRRSTSRTPSTSSSGRRCSVSNRSELVRRILIANRGEIAVRVARACFDAGLESVVSVSAADRDGLAALVADRAVTIGPPPAIESYLSIDRVLAAAKAADCDALHPGYGFLSERPELAEACEEEGIVFVGPPAAVMRRAGDKMSARAVAAENGIPTGAGSDGLESLEQAVEAAERTGYPLMLKASAGGGGRGMAIVNEASDLEQRFHSARSEAQQAFGDGRVYLERYVGRARHVEVQVLADTHGNVIHLGERDCSCQRRYQKLVEEAPAAGLDAALAEGIRNAAVELARALSYVGAGTVEFLVDTERGDFTFLEVNARVQVEHPVSEAVTGVDIVGEQLRIAAGERLSIEQDEVRIEGHAVECRINAEDPRNGFLPSPGTVTRWAPPNASRIRVDSHVQPGYEVSPYYDSLLAKVIAWGPDRAAALQLMRRGLDRFKVEGVRTTVPLLADIVAAPAFAAAPVTTRWLETEFLEEWNARPTEG
ncbi:MAG: acetyl-CoA carboxylase biotin carboxylase subunit [Actinobacteria bacterium]|nr:acetyl-CoA carboxylase biotin carboxylase subunit [Actinomycetota bacterium]